MAANVPAVVVTPPPASNSVEQALTWIRFIMEGNHNNICDEGGLKAFEDFVGLNERNVQYMDSGFSKRTTAQGHINFGMRCVKYTLVIIHWAQDEIRCSRKASLIGIADAEHNSAPSWDRKSVGAL